MVFEKAPSREGKLALILYLGAVPEVKPELLQSIHFGLRDSAMGWTSEWALPSELPKASIELIVTETCLVFPPRWLLCAQRRLFSCQS